MRSLFLILPLAAALAACSKKEQTATAPESSDNAQLPPEAAFQIEAQFAPSKNPNAATIQDRLQGAVHTALTAKLHLFIDTYKRMPENFYEFSNRMMDSVPPVPPGMKYEIDTSDKTVKVVKKEL